MSGRRSKQLRRVARIGCASTRDMKRQWNQLSRPERREADLGNRAAIRLERMARTA